MKNLMKLFGIIALVAIIGFGVVACDNGGGGGGNGGGGVPQAQTVTYTGTADSVTYTLKITENTNRAVVYTPVSGDSYQLTASGKTSTGTVSSFTAGTFTLKPANKETTFTATVSGTGITNLSGTITWSDNTTATAPGNFTGGSGGDGSGGGGVITEIEGGTIIAGFWYLSPPDNVDLDTFVFAYANYGDGLQGIIGSKGMTYKQMIASDGSYEKLIAYYEYTGNYYGTIKYKMADENPNVIYIFEIELAPGETFSYGMNQYYKDVYAYKIKDMDGDWIDYD